MKSWRHIGIFLGFLWGFCTHSWSLVDSLDAQFDALHEPQLRWDNIEGAPQWVSGVQPAYGLWEGMHIVSLEPGQSVTVRVPAYEMVRIRARDGYLAEDDVRVELSNGSGLFLTTKTIPGANLESLLVKPDAAYPQMARITRLQTWDRALELGIFVSRHLVPTETFPYRDVVDMTGPERPRIVLENRERGEAEDYWPMPPSIPIRVKLRGGTRYALETRFAYPVTESRLPQSHFVSVLVDGCPYVELEYVTSAEAANVIYIEHKPHAVGRLERAFFDLPDTGSVVVVELVTMAPLIGRLLELESTGYLFPGLNAPNPMADQLFHDFPDPVHNLWQMSESFIGQALRHGAGSDFEAEQVALRAARDNTRVDGPLLATMFLRRHAQPRRHSFKLRQLAAAIRGNHTFYRDVLPVTKVSRDPQEFAYFKACRLLPLNRPQAWRLAASQHTDALVGRLPGAFFNSIPYDDEGLVYHFEKRSCPTEVRLVIDQETILDTNRLAVQLDDDPLLPLTIELERSLPDADYAPNQGELGLEMLRRKFPGHHHDTLDVPFSQRKVTARLVRAGYIEFPIAGDVSRLRIVSLRSKGERHDVRVAVQLRSAKPYQFSETEYLGIVRQLQCSPYDLFVESLQKPEWRPRRRPERELQNHWQPLIRYLRSRHALVRSSVTPWSPSDGPGAQGILDKTRPDDSTARLEWLSARLQTASSLSERYELELDRATALNELGESFLAERQLRGLLLFAEEIAIRNEAAKRLRAMYELNGDGSAVETLLAVQLVKDPSEPLLAQLADHLKQAGEWDFSLQISLVLPPEEQSLDTMLATTLPLEWWGVFEQCWERLSATDDKRIWQGHRAWAQGRQDDAVRFYHDAGPEGQRYAKHIHASWQTRRDLLLGELEGKQRGMLAWAKLETALPGDKTWRREESIVVDYHSGVTLESLERNTFYRGFLSKPTRPMTLRFLGPQQLKLECRPVHSKNDRKPIDGWIQVREAGERNLLHVIPVMNNIWTAGLRATGRPELAVGTKVTCEYSFGPGVHEVVIESSTFDVCVSVSRAAPSFRCSYLPPISDLTLVALGSSVSKQKARLRWRAVALEYVLTGTAFDSQLKAIHDYHSYFPLPYGLQTRSRVESLAMDLRNSMIVHYEDLNNIEKQARLLAENRLNEALALPFDIADSDQAERRLTLYRWIVDQEPERFPTMLVHGSELQAKHPQLTIGRSLYASLSKQTSWERIHAVQSSAGTRDLDVLGWRPDAPPLRRRRALTGPNQANDYITPAGEGISTIVSRPDPSQIIVEARLLDLPYLPKMTATAILSSAAARRRIELTPGGRPVQWVLSFPPGTHRLHARVEHGVANQFLALRLFEQPPCACSTRPVCQKHQESRQPIERLQTRSCFISTADEPVRLVIAGPAWVRIDDWSGGHLTSRYEAVYEQMKVMTLYPADGFEEALFRLHRLVHRPREPDPTPPRPSTHSPESVARPVEAIASWWSTAAQTAIFDDQFELGWQENGTPSLTLRGVSRNSPDEETQALTNAERFLELSGSYRKYHPNLRLYSYWNHLARWRENGGPTMGWENRFDWHPDDRPYQLYFISRFLIQDPSGGLPLGGGDREWSLYTKAGISVPRRLSPQFYHVPSASIFGRLLSMDDRRAYETPDVDQDIYSPYKRNHRYGMQVSESLHYKPWQDTELYAGTSVGTNEDFNLFNPDNTRAWLGWRQQIGRWQTDLRFRSSHFFKDNDRRSSSKRQAISFGALGEHWFKNQTRLEYGGKITHYLDSSQNAVSLFLTWHFGEGRRYRDFRLGETHFRPLRERHIPPDTNNHFHLSHALPSTKK